MGEHINIQDDQYYQKIINEAKQAINGVSENIQEVTLDQYKNVVKRLTLARQSPIQAATSKGSYYAYRAAWIGYHANYIREKLPVLDIIKCRDYARWQTEAEELQYFINQLKECRPDPKRQQRQLAIDYDEAIKNGDAPNFEYSNEWREKVEHEKIIKESKSKKTRTRSLPNGWRDKLFQAALDKYSKHTLAIATMICTGCRPKELENGIDMSLDKTTGAIHFKINCAKRKNEAVEIREFTIKTDSSAFRYLQVQLQFVEGHMQLRNVKYKAASTEVSRLSEQTLNRRKEQASPYCFRHAFSGDLHAAGLTRTEIAQCLGHSTDKTQSYYSHSTKHSSGAFKITNIESTEAVKALTQDRIDSLLKQKNMNNIETIKP